MKFYRCGAVFVILTVVALRSQAGSCKYWCKHHTSYFCCPNGKSEMVDGKSTWPMFWFALMSATLGVHAPIHHEINPHHETVRRVPKMHCPPARWECPRSLEFAGPPTWCDQDEDCHDKWDKCCYDVCLEHKTCKPAQ